MLKCESLNLLKLQGQYLKFIVENYDELNILEHIENCEECQKEIVEAIEKRKTLFYFAKIFNQNLPIDILNNFSNNKNLINLIKSRIKCRKKKLNILITNAEMELNDLESRL